MLASGIGSRALPGALKRGACYRKYAPGGRSAAASSARRGSTNGLGRPVRSSIKTVKPTCYKESEAQQGSSSPVQPAGAPPAAAPAEAAAAPAPGIYAATELAPGPGCSVKVIGLGARGVSAAGRLVGGGLLAGADFWAIDTDPKVLSGAAGAASTLQLNSEHDASLSAGDLRRIAGAAATRGPVPAAAPPAATEGVVFLLAGAGAVPGGSPVLLQLASFLRRSGFFVVAALTRPFDFEGRRRLEEADALIEAAADVAQLSVVVAQGVLQRASAELTIKDASAIADNTLEYSVRSVLWALGAPEVLIASHAGAAWHGRDLRQYRRLLSPPLERLLTCPGAAALGRGLASIPAASLREAGLPSALSTLAEDAVTAAADSPFLDAAMGYAGGVMVVLSLPPRALDRSLAGGLQALDDPERYAVRAAVQAAASTVLDLAGATCHDVVACAHVRADDWPHGGGGEEEGLCIEATMLVLEDPALREAAAAAAADGGGFAMMMPRRPQGAGGGAGQGAGARPVLQTGGGGQQQQQQQPPAAPRANWNAMSALAGGSASAAHRLQKPGSPAPATPPQQPQQASRPSSSAGSSSNASSSSSSSSSRATSPMAGRPAAPRGPSPLVGTPPGPSASPRPGSAAGGDRRSPAPPSPAAGRPSTPPSGGPQQQQQQQPVPRMADRLVDSLVAQSLDLPPSAARWRSKQRAGARPDRRAGGHFALLGGGDGGAGAPPPDLRSRVAGMLEQEREEGAPGDFDAYDGGGDGNGGGGGGGVASR